MGNKTEPDRNRKTGLLLRLIEDLRLLFDLIKDFARGNYRRVPIRSIMVFAAACIYILFPLDLIPDYIPFFGQIDDAFVALTCLLFLEKDLYTYREWKNRQP